MKCIYLDMDGVLVDFVGAALDMYKVPREYIEKVDGWDRIPPVVSEYHGIELTDGQLWRDIACAGSEFWFNIEWLPWGQEVYKLCTQAAPTVLMTTPAGWPSAAGKLQWVEKNIGPTRGKDKVRFALTNCKHHFARQDAALIDDNTDNCKMFLSHGGRALLFPAHWNFHKSSPSRSFAISYVREFLNEFMKGDSGL